MLHEVGGHEHRAIEVLKFAEEDARKAVALEHLVGASLQKHVGLVEQDHGVPDLGRLEDVDELALQLDRVEAKLSDRYLYSQRRCWLAHVALPTEYSGRR